jgi:hypothetical protein
LSAYFWVSTLAKEVRTYFDMDDPRVQKLAETLKEILKDDPSADRLAA